MREHGRKAEGEVKGGQVTDTLMKVCEQGATVRDIYIYIYHSYPWHSKFEGVVMEHSTLIMYRCRRNELLKRFLKNIVMIMVCKNDVRRLNIIQFSTKST